MEELQNRLISLPNSYFGFVVGIMTYAKQKRDRAGILLDFLAKNEDVTPSDVVKFVMEQPDFHEFGYCKEQETLAY